MWQRSKNWDKKTKKEQELEFRNRKALKVMRRRPAMFQAMQWTGKNERDFDEFLIGKTKYKGAQGKCRVDKHDGRNLLVIRGVYDKFNRLPDIMPNERPEMALGTGEWLVWDPDNLTEPLAVYTDTGFRNEFETIKVGVHQWTKEDEEDEQELIAKEWEKAAEAMSKMSIIKV